MREDEQLAEQFETHRVHLRAVAQRMLGSLSDADDAVQEAWLRLSRVDVDAIENLAAWLRTVTARICLDMLRSRSSRREDLVGQQMPEAPCSDDDSGPEREAVLADSVGPALLVVLDTLEPAERVAFVLHDIFAVPFAEIAGIVDRTPVATKKLASRARRKVRGTPLIPRAELARRRQVVETFLTAARDGDLDAILTVLAPDVVRRADRAALPADAPAEVRGAHSVAQGVKDFGQRARFAEPALVDGAVGAVVARWGRLQLALTFTVEDDRITAYEVICVPERLARLELALIDGCASAG
ncbi:sigma-70 family RNA polymerase sigma factor [Streptomyces montanus]|uniref:Sigma-70 family RNA polymerase sigma factor n=1 Tax=Streptomyces montanus TaxID=2580423 RepID=A0A5R9FPC0_9ACTN|nr:sigma-70 family RNA polymerase sigma factor [Streptomyces montanus]TLS43770.1 sigma-70 family RNA polymerase sigma factor [Streptomyces montanus]